MKIICSKESLLKGMNIVSKAVPVRTTMKILECILFDATTDCIKLTGNDMELGIETKIEGQIIEKGLVAIDAKMIMEMIRKLPENDVTIESYGKGENIQIHITCENSDFLISGKDGEEFSYLPYIEKNNSFMISQITLRDMIRQTIFSIAANENNKMMTGELFEINNGILKLAALDGHRISIRRMELKDNYIPCKVVVPGKTLQEVSKILSGEAEDQVEISLAPNHIVFEFDQTIIISRLIDGEYFHIDQMISGDYDTKVTVNKKEFMNCIDRAILLIREGDKKPLVMDIKDGIMNLSIRSQIGKMNENISINKEGKDLMIGFNPKFLMDAIRVIEDEEISLYLMNPKAPCFIRNEGESYIYLILPVNFNGSH